MTNAAPASATHLPLYGDISGRNRVLPCPAIQARRRNSAQRSTKALPMRSATLPDGQSRGEPWTIKRTRLGWVGARGSEREGLARWRLEAEAGCRAGASVRQ